MPAMVPRPRLLPGIAAVIVIGGMLLPPAAGDARQYVFVQALQFAIFAVAGPALLVLAVPRHTRAPRPPGAVRPAARAVIRLAAFIAVTVTWRLPAAVNALARHPALAAAEMITSLAVGTGIWAELADSRPAAGQLPRPAAGQLPRPAAGQLPRPARAAIAAAATWTIWVLAYLTGMSGTFRFGAYHHGAPGGLGAAADQQIAAAILWAVPAVCFVPVVYVTVIGWLGGDTGSPTGRHPAAPASAPGNWPRPPRGWR